MFKSLKHYLRMRRQRRTCMFILKQLHNDARINLSPYDWYRLIELDKEWLKEDKWGQRT